MWAGGRLRSLDRSRHFGRQSTSKELNVKRTLVMFVTAAAIATATVTALVASSGDASAAAPTQQQQQQQQHSSLTVYLPGTKSRYVDTGAKGYSPGDYFLATGVLLDHQGGARVGGLAGIWTLVSPAADNASIIVHLPHGSMYVDGRIQHTKPSSTLRIAGGTGRYAHAHGRATFTYLSDTTASLRFAISY
jgi:hypothetical protein